MKETQSLLNRLAVCGVALAMVSTLAAQTVNQSSAKVIRIKGAARYKLNGMDWQQLKVGDVVKPGSLIQTAEKSRVDFALGAAAAPVPRSAASEAMSEQAGNMTDGRHLVGLLGHVLLRPVEPAVLEADHRIVVADRRDQHALHVGRRGRRDDLEARYVREIREQALRVLEIGAGIGQSFVTPTPSGACASA